MTKLINTKILLSGAMIVAAAAVVIGATFAFFSDTETSTGNVLAAGALDLQIDSEAHYAGLVCTNGVWEEEIQDESSRPDLIGDDCVGTWTLTDLTDQVFFNLTDLKPGDVGENTISIHVDDNDAWVCARVSNLVDADNTVTDPESDLGDDDTTGELSQNMLWTIWSDNGEGGGTAGDNVQNGSEPTLTSGTPTEGVLALFDSNTGDPLTGGETNYLGALWEIPSEVGNIIQTDSLSADISFYVEQARNNEEFTCDDVEWPLPEAQVTVDTSWSLVDTDADGGGAGKEWFAKSRDNNGGFEVAVGTNDTLPETQDTADATWVAGASNPFTLTYDGAGTATYSTGGQTVTFAVGETGYGRIGINVKASAGVTTTVDSLSLDVAAPLSTDNHSVVGVGNDVENILISGVNLDQAWELTGNITFSLLDGGSAEYPAVQFSID